MATFYVSAVDSSTEDKTFSNYDCTGTGDQAQINSAIVAAGAGGHVVLLPGTYSLSGSVLIKVAPFHLEMRTGAILRMASQADAHAILVSQDGGIAPPVELTGTVEITGGEIDGNCQLLTDGTVTAATSTTITDTTANFGATNAQVGNAVWIHSGTGSGQSRKITASTATQLTVSPAWTTTPDSTSPSKYAITNQSNKPNGSGTAGGGITACGVERLVIERVYLHDTLETPINVRGCASARITRNFLKKTGIMPGAGPRNGINVEWQGPDTTNYPAERFVISQNQIRDFQDVGINFHGWGNTGATISENTIGPGLYDATGKFGRDGGWAIGMEMEGEAYDNAKVAITGNILRSVQHGVILSADITTPGQYYAVAISGNVCTDLYGNGISVRGSNISVTGNVINRFGLGVITDARGLSLGPVTSGQTGQKNVSFTGNTVYCDVASSTLNRNGVFLQPGPSGETNTKYLDGCTVANNLLYGPGTANTSNLTSGIWTSNQITNLQIIGNTVRGWHDGSKFETDRIRIINNIFENNGSSGIGLPIFGTTSILEPYIAGNYCADNGWDTGASHRAGIVLVADKALLLNNVLIDTRSGASRTQQEGVKFKGTPPTNTTIVGGRIANNVNAPITAWTSPAVTVVRGVDGVNPKGNVTAPAVPASTVATTNTTGYDCTVYIVGGTSVSAITVGGVATGLTATPAMVRVPAGQTIAITYGSAPTWTWFAD